MTYGKDEENLIALACIDEVSLHIKSRLVCDGSIPDKEKYAIKTLPQGVYNIVKDKYESATFRRRAIDMLDEKGIKCVTYFSDDYPESLKNIDDPPTVLFCRGNTALLKDNCFAVVGSRKSTAGALALTKKLCAEMSGAFTVVTGTAEGADGAAISGALPSGRIISVLASGFDNLYPATNAALIASVAKSGLVITEYLPHIQSQKFFFPYRNRLIAGLSRGTLVVSAGEKSGALITAEYALDYGREVFAFPYSVGVASGAGCNNLIKNGAYLTENILDIFSVFGLDLKKSERGVTLSAEESAVLDQMKITGEGFLPAMAENLHLPAFQLVAVLTSLEIKNLVVRLGGNRYAIV